MFNRHQGNPLVVGYANVDYTWDLDDMRSTTSYVFTLLEGPTCWKSMVQSIVALYITQL